MLFIVLIGLLAAYWSTRILGESVNVPSEFLEARNKGAVLADSIVHLAGESVNNLKRIEQHNDAKRYENGLDSVFEEISRNETARRAAIELSAELEVMANSLSEIQPQEASDLALRAIIVESQIVQRLINYNGYIYELLNLFRLRFEKNTSVGEKPLKDIVSDMNALIREINTLNAEYKELMRQFDSLTLKEN